MPTSAYVPAPSQGSSFKVLISAVATVVSGAEGIPDFGPEKPKTDTTGIADLAASYMGGVPDNGEFTITGPWDSRDAGQAHLYASAQIPGAVDSFESDFAKAPGATSAAKATFSGEVLSFKISGPKGHQRYASKIQINGVVALTPAV